MTHRRSFYLDDLQPTIGATVICKADMGREGFTVGAPYIVQPDLVLFNDRGVPVRGTSARFQPSN